MSAALALRVAIRTSLLADAELAALLGSAAIYDDVPAEAGPPYVLLGDHLSRDRSVGQAPAEEHELALQVWSTRGGLKQTLEIAEAVIACLAAQAPTPANHRLVNLGWLSTDARRAEEGQARWATLRFRALTEPA